MPEDLDFVGKLSDKEKLYESFRLDCISPDDGKYREDCDALRSYISHHAEWKACAKVQQALLETGVKFGRGTKENLDEMEYAMQNFDPVNVDFIEREVTKHDQLAVIEELGRYLSEDTKTLLHPGTTSYDIIDTARSYNFKRAWKEEIRPRAVEIVEKLCELGEHYIDVIQVGRTHLQDTSPVRFGGEISKYAKRLARRIEKSDQAFESLEGKVSGIVGTGSGTSMIFGEKAEEFEAEVLKKLDLKPDTTATQIVQKDNLADAANSLVTMSNVIADFSNDMRILYSSSIGEVTSRDNQKRLGGSSTDAGKNNPINYENIVGKQSVIESGMKVIYELGRSDLSRDLRGSVQARYEPHGMMSRSYQSLVRLSKTLKKLSVNTDMMEKNLEPVRDFPTEATVTIMKGERFVHSKYGIPHDFVKEMAKKSMNENTKLIDTCLNDDEFRETYEKLPEYKKDILNGKIENYLGFSRKRTFDNINYARKVIS